MSGMNKVFLIGHLGRDPELTFTTNGTAVLKFSLATTENRKVGDNWESQTEWHRVVMFGKRAEAVNSYLQKGSKVHIEGKIKYGNYEKDGIKHYTTDIIAYGLLMLDKKEDRGTEPSSQPQQTAQQQPKQSTYEPDPSEDDLPF